MQTVGYQTWRSLSQMGDSYRSPSPGSKLQQPAWLLSALYICLIGSHGRAATRWNPVHRCMQPQPSGQRTDAVVMRSCVYLMASRHRGALSILHHGQPFLPLVVCRLLLNRMLTDGNLVSLTLRIWRAGRRNAGICYG